uniref:ATP synthase F0 subunit 8 n=1 Tax=Micronecta sahlbergii TaxID=2304347 RepID=A0A346LZK1_9HEMI|nr:ATP synthase F0 subunit 8 [Micronecta sahlbergii]AXQ02196.1 ATP synthase F0 subunit 8 [Micronecta sahlbergii]
MPQMSPMYWLSLFMMFNLLIMMFTQMIYFSNNKQPVIKMNKISSQNMNWKW